jgi:DNA-binding MarR family transcriptional regulator
LITEKGRDILREIDEGPDIVSEVMANVSEEEMEALSHLLDKIRCSN